MCPYPMLKELAAEIVSRRRELLDQIVAGMLASRPSVVSKAEAGVKRLNRLEAEVKAVLERDERTYPRMLVKPCSTMSGWGYRYSIQYVEAPGVTPKAIDWASSMNNAHRLAVRYLKRDRQDRAAQRAAR